MPNNTSEPTMLPSITCPNCNEILNYVEFEMAIHGYQVGNESFPLDHGNTDYGDQEITDEERKRYSCPECGENIAKQYILDNTPRAAGKTKTKIENTDIPPAPENAIEENNQQIVFNHLHSRFNSEMPINPQAHNKIIKCPECKYEYNTETLPDGFCPKCKYIWTITDKDIAYQKIK